jgi:hypothetical protein
MFREGLYERAGVMPAMPDYRVRDLLPLRALEWPFA